MVLTIWLLMIYSTAIALARVALDVLSMHIPFNVYLHSAPHGNSSVCILQQHAFWHFQCG